MCGYCCGSVPIEKRGEGHRHCSETCYNAPIPATVRKLQRDLGDLRAAVAALADEWDAQRDAHGDALRALLPREAPKKP